MLKRRSLTVADWVVQCLKSWGIRYVFGLPGDSVIPLLEAIRTEPAVEFISVRHEETAGFMASALAKLTGGMAACLADAGPGAVHLLSGLYDAALDRVPVLALTGEVPAKKIGTHWPQSINHGQLFQDATVFNHTLAAPEQAVGAVWTALRQAWSQRGVARVGLPKDLQGVIVSGQLPPLPHWLKGPLQRVSDELLQRAADLLQQAERPVLFAGQGARDHAAPLLQLAERLSAAVVHTLPAIGILPWDHPHNLGVIGKFGTPAAARIISEADVLFVVGSTWWQPQYLPLQARYIQLDTDRTRIGAVFPAELGLVGDAGDALRRLADRVAKRYNPAWMREMTAARSEFWSRVDAVSALPAAAGGGGRDPDAIRPEQVIRALAGVLPRDAIVSLDVGDNTFWFSQQFRGNGQRVVLSGHWRSMGFGLAGAMASKLVQPQRPALALVGDGGFGMGMIEFTTAVRHNLALAVVVMNNGAYGEEAHNQQRMGVPAFGSSFHNPDFAAYARACGGAGYTVRDAAELVPTLQQALAGGKPCVIDVHVANVMPEEPPGWGQGG